MIPLEQYNKEIPSLTEKIQWLKERLALLTKHIFGQRAKKFIDTQPSEQLLFEGFDKLRTPEPTKRLQDHLQDHLYVHNQTIN